MSEYDLNNNEGVEEVPLDLFDQVTLEENDSVEMVDLSESSETKEISKNAIKIPADAYLSVLQSQRSGSEESQQ